MKDDVIVWEELGLEADKAHKLNMKFKHSVEDNLYWNLIIKDLKLSGDKCFLAFLLGQTIASERIQAKAKATFGGVLSKFGGFK